MVINIFNNRRYYIDNVTFWCASRCSTVNSIEPALLKNGLLTEIKHCEIWEKVEYRMNSFARNTFSSKTDHIGRTYTTYEKLNL